MLRKIFGREDNDSHEFKPLLAEIEDNPASPLGRTIFWIIVSVILFTALWMFFGKIDVVVSARGKIIPDGEMKILQPLDSGVVDNILVKEGDFVKKGQVVMEINPSAIAPQLQSSQKNLQLVQLEMNRLNAASEGGSFRASGGYGSSAKTQADLYVSSVDSLQKQLAAKMQELKRIDAQISSTATEKINYQKLLNVNVEKEKRLKPVVDIIPKEQYDKVITDISTYQSNIQEDTFKLEELSHQQQQTLAEIDYIRQNFKFENLKELSDRQKQAAELTAQVKEASFKNTKQRIISPVDGYVNTLFVHTIGGVITPAEKLLSIVPINTPMVIKATVLNKDIGFIKPKMPVSVKIDTFEFQKYGILKGIVKTISKNSVDNEKLGPVYDVYITPIDKSLMVEGKREFISPGMSLSAEIKVNKRRVIEFFIYPLIKYWNEGISVR